MTKFIFIIFSSLFIVITTNAQSSELLLGKWRFVDFYNSGVGDSLKLENARAMYKKFSMTFKGDQHYIFYFVGKEKGIWKYTDSTKSLSMINQDNNEEEILNVVSLTDDKLIITFQDLTGFILEKVKANSKPD